MDTQTQPPRPNPSFSSPIIPQQRTRALVNGAAGAAAAGRIPPSLQAKMAALANRSQQANNATNKQNAVNETVEALMRATLADRPPLHPSGAAALSTPGLGGNPIMRMGQGGAGAGMAARRAKPGMKLSDMSGFGGAAETFGLREIRLELEDQKLNAILMELDILHRAVAPEIVEFYGAFFVEGCVYYCMEYMDAGSLDKLQGSGVDEPVLARISGAMVRGLKFLKDHLQIMHRDVKPTNVLVSRQGVIKLCDFGVSGQLEKSLAKTNIGCQSYMAPERIQGESINNVGTYSVSSDVWSLGLSIIEVAMGTYPYPPETYANVFAQLTAIVQGDPPTLPDGFSDEACDFVARWCVYSHVVPVYIMRKILTIPRS
ncbi:hypothetical protein FRC19_003110 [Serendipita sp. 401]|nr:hypothetical protein FRC19_003110 [Serendipita sp. 401]